jgi:hypothetical protein
MKHATSTLVVPNPTIDGLVADAELARAPKASSDLLRAPLLLEAGNDQGPVLGHEPLVTPRAGTPATSEIIGDRWPIAPIVASVAPDFTAHRTRVTAQRPSDLGL